MATTDSRREQPSLAFIFGLFAAGALFFVVILHIQRFWNARHPAVSEHRRELVEAAAKSLNCAPDAMTISVEEPTRARVDGCGNTATFRWGYVRGTGLPQHWRTIDPNCRVDYMGFKLRCE